MITISVEDRRILGPAASADVDYSVVVIEISKRKFERVCPSRAEADKLAESVEQYLEYDHCSGDVTRMP